VYCGEDGVWKSEWYSRGGKNGGESAEKKGSGDVGHEEAKVEKEKILERGGIVILSRGERGKAGKRKNMREKISLEVKGARVNPYEADDTNVQRVFEETEALDELNIRAQRTKRVVRGTKKGLPRSKG